MARKKEDVEEKILDVDASMQGTITFKDPVNLRINGSFEGRLDTRGNLTIGENAKVNANIDGDRIIVAGKVTGDIKATQSVSVIPPAVINGNIHSPKLSVQEGAVIEGQISMLSANSAGQGSDVTMRLKDIAQYLEVESKVVQEWAENKKIPASQDKSGWVFSKNAVDRWIQEESVKS